MGIEVELDARREDLGFVRLNWRNGMQYVLYRHKDQSNDGAADVSRLHETPGIQVIHQSGDQRALLVEFEGSADAMRQLAGGLAGWSVSESRTYQLL